MNPDDIQKTAIITPFELFEYKYMTFAAQTFQRHMSKVLDGLDFIFPYIDDILIASSNADEQEKHIIAVFDRFKKFNMSINIKKCVFGQTSMEFLDQKAFARLNQKSK